MTTSIATTSPVLMNFTKTEVNIIRNTICHDMDDGQLSYCLNFCKNVGLNPIKRQVFFLKQNIKDNKTQKWYTKITPYIALSGYQVIAHRSGRFDGAEGPFWADEDGVWHDCLPKNKTCHACRYIVYLKGFARPFVSTIYWEEFGEPNMEKSPTWKKMHLHMMGVRAKTHAFRDGWPDELGGTITEEEILNSDNLDNYSVVINDEPARPVDAPPPPHQQPLGNTAPVTEKSPEQKADESKRKILLQMIDQDLIPRIWTNGDKVDYAKMKQEIGEDLKRFGSWGRKLPQLKKWTTKQLEEFESYLREIVSHLAGSDQPELTGTEDLPGNFSTDLPKDEVQG